MKKFFVFTFVVVVTFLFSQQSFAAKICLQDNFGDFFIVKGGRVDKKSWVVKIDVPGVCVITGHAETSLNSSGQTVLGMLTSHDVGGACNTVRFIMLGDEFLNSTGSFDQNGNGTIDGAVTFTQVGCGSLPPFGSKKTVNPDSPFIKKK